MADNIVLTGYDDVMSPLGDITSKRMAEYAKFYGFDFNCVRSYHNRMHPSFQKVEATLSLLGVYQNVIWIDADAYITNPYINPLRFCKPGLNVSVDWGRQELVGGVKLPETRHFSMGVFVATWESVPVLEWALRQYEWHNVSPWEQGAIQDGATYHSWIRDLIHIHPSRHLNAVDKAIVEPIDPETGRPFHEGNPPVDPWQEGDWLCHLTGRPMTHRLHAIEGYNRTGSF